MFRAQRQARATTTAALMKLLILMNVAAPTLFSANVLSHRLYYGVIFLLHPLYDFFGLQSY